MYNSCYTPIDAGRVGIWVSIGFKPLLGRKTLSQFRILTCSFLPLAVVMSSFDMIRWLCRVCTDVETVYSSYSNVSGLNCQTLININHKEKGWAWYWGYCPKLQPHLSQVWLQNARRIDRQAGKQMGKQAGGWMDRRTNRHTTWQRTGVLFL